MCYFAKTLADTFGKFRLRMIFNFEKKLDFWHVFLLDYFCFHVFKDLADCLHAIDLDMKILVLYEV